MKLFTTNELGNYITKRLSFLLKEKPEYVTEYVKDKRNKYRKVRKHISAYFNRAEIEVYFDYEWREVVVSPTTDKTYVFSLLFQKDDYLSSEIVDTRLEILVSKLPPF